MGRETEIVTGLKNAISRGEDPIAAMKSFVNAGYTVEEVNAAAKLAYAQDPSLASKSTGSPAPGTPLPQKTPTPQPAPAPQNPKTPPVGPKPMPMNAPHTSSHSPRPKSGMPARVVDLHAAKNNPTIKPGKKPLKKKKPGPSRTLLIILIVISFILFSASATLGIFWKSFFG